MNLAELTDILLDSLKVARRLQLVIRVLRIVTVIFGLSTEGGPKLLNLTHQQGYMSKK